MRYRRSVYRKKRIKIIVSVTASVLLLIVILFVIVGNSLGNKVEEYTSKRSSKATETEQTVHASVSSVNAYPVPLSAENSKLSTRLAKAAANGYTQVCFELDSADGALLYSSPIAQSLGKQPSGLELWKLDDVAKLCDDSGLYAIGIVHLSDFYKNDDLARSAAMGYYAAQVAEALRSGVDDVLIYVGNIPTERYTEVSELAKQIRRLCPDGSIGISLPAYVYADSNTVDRLWEAFDYLAVDLSVPDDGVDAADHVGNSLGNMLYYLLRYNVRVLVPYTDDADLAARITQAVTANGSNNIQIMPT